MEARWTKREKGGGGGGLRRKTQMEKKEVGEVNFW